MLDELQVDAGMGAQRIDIRVVADARQLRYQHLEGAAFGLRRFDGVLRVEEQALQIGQHGQYGLASLLLQPVDAGL